MSATPRPPLTPEQRQLAERSMSLVESCADAVARRYRGRVAREDLLGPGTIALYEAAVRYRQDEHPSFPHYAQHHVHGRMIDSVRQDHFSLRARVEHAMERGFARMIGHLTLDVDMFKGSDQELREGSARGCADTLASSFIAGLLAAEKATPEDDAADRQDYTRCLEMLREGLATVYAHEREVIELFYFEGLTLDEVGDRIGMHKNTAQRRHVAGLRKLRKFLEARGMMRAP